MTRFCRKVWELLLVVDIWEVVDSVCDWEEVDERLLAVEEEEDAEGEDVTDVKALVEEEEVTEEDVVRAVVEDVWLIEMYTPVIKITIMITAAIDTAIVLVIARFTLFNRLNGSNKSSLSVSN